MTRQCEAALEPVLEIRDGWPVERRARCRQSVGLGVLRDAKGEPHAFCRDHYAKVDAQVRRSDGDLRAQHDADEDAQAERLARIAREAVRSCADRREEMRLIRPGVVR